MDLPLSNDHCIYHEQVHPVQLDLEHPLQEQDDALLLKVPPDEKAKAETSFSTLSLPHDSHRTSSDPPKVRTSKVSEQARHRYS